MSEIDKEVKKFKNIDYLIYFHGKYAPIILFSYCIYLIWAWNKTKAFFYFFFGYIIDLFINLILKALIAQPRPNINEKQFKIAQSTGKRFIMKNGIPYDIYGMPSGHTQSSFFSTIFIYFLIPKYYILIFCLLICICTMYQRVHYNHHTLNQVFVGAIIGCLVGYICFYIYKSSLKPKINEKEDENASD